ncbi:putative exported protein [Halobacteriovorax marinus SJ]|uniref:Exported protein n=1 Tax=Halobacteriovorax marinus (strain ATCC BAA-682 / DSM 15412 / SJ) TaxID=862908 RepID=E1X5Z1_HALMS|nr:hypothetical protein [Halobacteriovorax marinus]CBW25708.1 putative exported protein [Halobacteriovorax marinus SJ]
MKKLLALTSILLSTASFAYVTGDKIHFQKDSTYVSAAYSKSLCFDGENFKANIRKCTRWTTNDERRCTRYGVFAATQPQESTRKRCARWGGRDDSNCLKWETVRYFQSEVRTVKFYGQNDDLRKTETIVIPTCM